MKLTANKAQSVAVRRQVRQSEIQSEHSVFNQGKLDGQSKISYNIFQSCPESRERIRTRLVQY